MRINRRGVALGAAITGGLALFGCASDAASVDRGGNDAGGGIYSKLGVKPPGTKKEDGDQTPMPFDFGTVPSPYDSPAACKTFSSADTPKGFHADTRACLCDNCYDLQRQCDALQGCQQIMKCVLDIGCTDANTCYLGPSKTAADPEGKGCIEVIDLWGNGGVATALSNLIGTCSTMYNCIPPAGQ